MKNKMHQPFQRQHEKTDLGKAVAEPAKSLGFQRCLSTFDSPQHSNRHKQQDDQRGKQGF